MRNVLYIVFGKPIGQPKAKAKTNIYSLENQWMNECKDNTHYPVCKKRSNMAPPKVPATVIKIANGKAGSNTAIPDYNRNNASRAFSDDGFFCAGSDGARYGAKYPHLVWYRFPTTHIPTKFSFTRYSDRFTPKTWQFVGSADENCDRASKWDMLCGDSSGSNFVVDAVMSCDVPKNDRKPYKCLGICIFSNNNDNKQGDLAEASCMSGMRFWEAL